MKFKKCLGNRSRMEIKKAVIDNLKTEMYLSELMFCSNTNYITLSKIINELKEKNLIIEIKGKNKRRIFKLTEKGLEIRKELDYIFKEYLL